MSGMDFRGAASRARSLIAAKKPAQLQTSALKPEALRDNVIREHERDSERFRTQAQDAPLIEYEREQEDGTKVQENFEWTAFPEAVRDVARASYGYDQPELARPEQIRPSYQLNRAVLQDVIRSDEFKENYPHTRGNGVESTFGALALAGSLKQSAETRLAEHVARAEEMGEREQEQTEAQNLIEKLRDEAKQQKAEAGEVDPNLVDQMRDAVAAREQAKADLSQLAQDQRASTMRADAKAAAKAGAEAMGEAVQAMRALGELAGIGDGPGESMMDPDQQIALAEEFAKNAKLREILRDLGRKIRDFRFRRSARTKNVPVEPVGVTTGRELERMLPHELARAYMPELRPVWMKDYSERSLLVTKMEGKSPAGEGPIVIVQDGSASMSNEFGGTSRLVWAKGIEGMLIAECTRTKRAMHIIEFGSANQLRTWTFPERRPVNPQELVEMMSHFFGGGTSTRTGMAEALRCIREDGEFSTADVVLLGDGQDSFTDSDQKIRDELRALDVRIHGISIAMPDNAYMNQMCEYTIDVASIAEEGAALDALAEQIT